MHLNTVLPSAPGAQNLIIFFLVYQPEKLEQKSVQNYSELSCIQTQIHSSNNKSYCHWR